MLNHNEFGSFSSIVGIDIAKSVFQVYCVDANTGEVTNEKVKRAVLLERFANRPPCLIGMESCSTSQYWARKLQALGHTVRLMDCKLVKPFVMHNKSDQADAEGIFHALMQGVRTVAIKNEMEHDISILLTMRAKKVEECTASINHVRGLLAEYGQTMGRSVSQFDRNVDDCINALEGNISQLVVETLRDNVKEIRAKRARLKDLKREITRLAMQTKHAQHLLSVPGVGHVIMAYMCVLLADPSVFSSGRQFAAYLGLVPMHTGSGGKTITTHIPGRCDRRLRALMVEGAHSVARSRHPAQWVTSILAKKPKKVALIAIANRMARQCWAVASKGQYWRQTPIAAA